MIISQYYPPLHWSNSKLKYCKELITKLMMLFCLKTLKDGKISIPKQNKNFTDYLFLTCIKTVEPSFMSIRHKCSVSKLI